jgi:hypothetical protein
VEGISLPDRMSREKIEGDGSRVIVSRGRKMC